MDYSGRRSSSFNIIIYYYYQYNGKHEQPRTMFQYVGYVAFDEEKAGPSLRQCLIIVP